MDKLRALRYFLAVASTGSFSMAARTLAVPASSVSRRIRDLEEHLGVELFHRSTRVVRLTELGMLYRSQVCEAVENLDFADALVGDRSDEPAGNLVVTCTASYGHVRLLPVLERFADRYPQIVLDVSLTDQVVDLARGEVDLAIRGTAQLPERCVARLLTPHAFRLVGSPAYLSRRGRPRVLADLARHSALLYRNPDGVSMWQARQGNDWRKVPTVHSLVTNDGLFLLHATCAGRGLALLPHWGCRPALERGDLVQVTLEDAELSITSRPGAAMYLLYYRPRYQLHKIRVAVDFLLDELVEPVAARSGLDT
ncbi:MAG: LysR substrate-binding domain-containing protein [Myxococcota bacterium]